MKIKTLSTIRSYPYVYRSFLPHRVMTVAIKPVNKAVQSKNMWNESDIRPRLRREKKKKYQT